ncbi:MAG: hypothetical protein MUF83_22380 [Acidimicrobiales bacterium]|jgi:hypothetical protein|nr:hypothetical protein [Acidimicrobiales bacterium]
MSGRERRPVSVLRAVVAAVVLVLSAALAFGAAAWLADRVSEQPDEVVQAPIGDPVVVPGPSMSTDGETSVDGQADAPADPGAVVALEEAGPVVDGLSGGAWVLPVDLVAADDPGSLAATQAQSETAAATPGATLIPADQAASTAEQLGEASLQPPLTAARFVDLCTEGASACPLGVAATVTPLSDDTVPAELAIRVWPGLTRALVPNLRCDPGLPSSSVLPVLVTANAPLVSLELALELPDGTLLSNAVVGASASETSWITSWRNTGQTAGTDLDNSAHYCAAVATLGDPAVASALQAAGKAAPVPLAYRLRAVARTPVDPASPNTPPREAVVVVDVPGDSLPTGTGGRPNTIVQPLDGHVAQVVVPERNDMTARPTVWVANAGYWQDKSGLGSATAYCTKAPPGTPNPGYHDPPRPILVPQAQSYDPGQLALPSYPFDPGYASYGVWNVVLEEGTTYALCISWPLTSGEEREAWTLETPNGLRFSLVNLFLVPNGDQPYTTWYLRGDDAGCYNTFPPDVQGGDFCASRGLPYPPVVTFQQVGTYPTPYTGSGTVTHELGSTRLQTPTWCPGFVAGLTAQDLLVQAAGGSTSLLAQCLSGSTDIRAAWPVTFVYADQNVLCGSDSCLDEHRRATVSSAAAVGEGMSNGRSRDPLDWGISGPSGDRSASPGGAAGPGLP